MSGSRFFSGQLHSSWTWSETLRNMANMLESAGWNMDRIVKMTVVLAESAECDEMTKSGATALLSLGKGPS